jgi:hypothetical protein
LINRERWQRDKENLIARAGLQDFTDPKKVLAELDELLYQHSLKTNRHIASGQNEWMSFSKKGAFRLKTPKQEEVDAEPLQSFFPDK